MPSNILPSWISLMSAVAMLVTSDPTIAADMLPRFNKKKRYYKPPKAASAEAESNEVRREHLGHPDDWGGRDNLSWICMWAGSSEVVEAAIDSLVLALQMGRIEARARNSDQAPYQPIPAEAWVGATLLSHNKEAGLILVARFRPDGTPALASDLVDVLVSTADLFAELLPLSVLAASGEIVRTGVAGRPTSAHLFQQEHQRRLKSGEAHKAVAEEARHLASWLKTEHPSAPTVTPKSIENVIRVEHRRHNTPENMP